MAIVSPEGRWIEVNQALARILGRTSDELLRLPVEELIHPDDRAAERALAHRALAGELPGYEIETRYLRKDGRPVVVLLTTSVVRTGSGRPLHVVLQVQDISQRKSEERSQAAQHAATQALAESVGFEDGLNRVVASVGQALDWHFGCCWIVDREAAVLRPAAIWTASDAFRPFADASAALTLARGVGLPGRVFENGEPVWVPDAQKAPATGRGSEAAAVGLRAAFASPVALAGDLLGVLELRSTDVQDADMDLARTFATIGAQLAQFIERDAADRAFRVSEGRMRSVIDSMLEGLVVVTEAGVIESVNPAAEQIFGYASWELIGQHVRLLLPRSAVAQGDAYLKDAYRKAIGRITEWEGRRKDGELVRFELSLYEIWSPEGTRHLAGHIRDVSDKRKLERMKKEFVSTVSHELRTPLTSIRGSLSLLAGGALGDLPDEAKDVVAIAERNTVRLMGLINDILDLERLETGRMELAVSPTSASEIVRRSIESVAGMAETQGVRVEAEESPAEVLGDPDRLSQVLVNLLSNAVKFSARGGVVRVTARAGGDVEFRVADSGRGIPASLRESIFHRFQQVEASDSRQKGGSGLGLAICKAIVELHGGTIGVESQVGKGSTFWFRVPAAHPTEAEPPPQRDRFLDALSSHDRSADIEVLLADHDDALLGILARQLLGDGLPVRTATTAPRALRLARERRPGLMVLDFGLPGGEGRRVLDALRRDPALKDVPLLVYTGRDLTAEERAALTLGPTRYLTKSRSTDAHFRAVVLDMLREAAAGSAP
jgi:PAS domain S-box-containing protein